MTTSQAKGIFIFATLISTVFFAGLTYDTHSKFALMTHGEKLTPQVASGKWIWQKYNCNDCHTILGIGGYYAPDLTKVTTYRDADWLRKFIKEPAKVWPEERKMPTLHLSESEVSDIIAFLAWTSGIDTNGWPPKPLVGSASAAPKPGESIFNAQGCSACHRINGVGGTIGPDLSRVGSRRDKAWIEDQIMNPKIHNPNSIMPSFAKLSDNDVEQLADYLTGLK